MTQKSREIDAYIAQSPLDKPIPYALVVKTTKFRVKENSTKRAKKR